MAGEILRLCPNVALLITSRERLNLTSESRYELGGLDYPTTLSPDDAMGYTAVRLFVDSGRRVRPGFELTGDNVADIIRICRLVRGMPLALILAAGWLEILKSAEIAIEIEQGLEFLAGDMADLPERQRSMRAVFDRSWHGLSPEEAAVMARLSIFRGGFTRESAENVAGANLRILLALVNKSLLQRRAEDGRFDVHELLRQFAAEQRRQIDPDGSVELAHCREFARLVDTEVRRQSTPVLDFRTERLVAEPDNIRRAWAYAVEHALAEELAILASGIYALGMAEGSHHRFLLEQAWQSLQQSGLPDTHPDMIRLRGHLLISMWGFETRGHVKDFALKFVPLVEEYGDLELRFWLYMNIAGVLAEMSDTESLNWIEKAISVALEMGDELIITLARASELIHRIIMGQGDNTALPRLESYVSYFETRKKYYYIISDLLGALTSCCLSLHDYERAVYYGKRWLNMAKSERHLYLIGSATGKLAEIRLEMGLPQAAAEHLLDNLDWHLAIGKVWQTLGAMFSVVLGFMPLFGGSEKAVPILSMVYHHPEAIPLYREIMDADLPRLEVEMGAETYAAAWERGKALDFDVAVAWMRAALSPEADRSI